MKSRTLTKFAKYVSLGILGMLGLSFYILADTFFIANRLGPDGLAALNLVIPIYSFISGLGLMLGIGGATKYAILTARQEGEKANNYFNNTLFMGFLISVVLIFIGRFGSTNLSRLLGADKSTFQMTNIYLKTILLFTPVFILNNIMLAFVRNDGAPRLSMLAMLTGSFSNIILDYIFMYPLNMGMFGAAFATGLAPIISLAVLSSHFRKKRNRFYISKFRPEINVFSAICSLGMSSLITELSSGIVLIIFNLLILNLTGNLGVAAYGIVANLALVATAVFVGIGQGIQPLASRDFGKGRLEELKKTLQYAIVLSILIAVFFNLIAFAFTDKLVSIFNSEDNLKLAGLAGKGLRLYFTGFIFAGLNIVITAYLSAIQRAGQAFFISIGRGFIAIIPLALILSYLFAMEGVWLSFPAAEVTTAMISAYYLIQLDRREVRVTGEVFN
ncbi:MAG: MATE family efflux transporter [Halanaerobiales bacterium]